MGVPSWAEQLLAATGFREHADAGENGLALSSQLAEIWRNARATWPSVELDAEAFLSHLALHVPAQVPATDYLSQVNTADLYLACACAMGDEHAVAAFERHCLSGLDRTLARLRFSADVISEVKQRVRCRVLVGDGERPCIADFTGRGDLRAWVRVIAVRQALRLTRRSRREIETDDPEKLQVFMAQEHAGLEGANADYRRAFARAFDRALRGLPPRERTMLRQHVLDGLTVDQLGALYRVHRATAARTLERARRTVLAATRAHMRAELDVGSTELSSILRTIRSRLEVTLRGLRRRERRRPDDRAPGSPVRRPPRIEGARRRLPGTPAMPGDAP